jgi:hypothetical protein
MCSAVCTQLTHRPRDDNQQRATDAQNAEEQTTLQLWSTVQSCRRLRAAYVSYRTGFEIQRFLLGGVLGIITSTIKSFFLLLGPITYSISSSWIESSTHMRTTTHPAAAAYTYTLIYFQIPRTHTWQNGMNENSRRRRRVGARRHRLAKRRADGWRDHLRFPPHKDDSPLPGVRISAFTTGEYG